MIIGSIRPRLSSGIYALHVLQSDGLFLDSFPVSTFDVCRDIIYY